MGTDINVVVQILKNKRWEIIEEKVRNDRSYNTFRVLANIRSAYTRECISPPKGFPTDFEHDKFFVKTPYNEEIWLGDCAHSWYTLIQLLETNISFEDTYLDDWVIELLALKKKYKVPLTGIRVVFGFDS